MIPLRRLLGAVPAFLALALLLAILSPWLLLRSARRLVRRYRVEAVLAWAACAALGVVFYGALLRPFL